LPSHCFFFSFNWYLLSVFFIAFNFYFLSLYNYCYKHKNYQDKWQKDRFKFKSKIPNKRTKTRIKKIKPKTKNVQNQSINKYLLQWSKQTWTQKNSKVIK
jgi:hypothetical protein